MKILISQLRNHGDIIRSFPLVEAIKEVHPDWFVGYTCYPNMVETCALCHSVDKIFPQPRLTPVTNIQGGTRVLDCSIFEDIVSEIKEYSFDTFVDLHGVFQSALMGCLCNIKTRLGRSRETAKDGATLFYTDIASVPSKNINRMERHFKIVQHLYPEIKYDKILSDTWRCRSNVTIFPGTSITGRLKRWNPRKYIQLAEYISSFFPVAIVLGPEEYEMLAGLEMRKNVNLIHASDWHEILNIIQNSRFVIANDSVYAHMSIWQRTPTIMLLGATPFEVNGVWKFGPGVNIYHEPRCTCPDAWSGVCDKNHYCMESISVDDVISRIKDFL